MPLRTDTPTVLWTTVGPFSQPRQAVRQRARNPRAASFDGLCMHRGLSLPALVHRVEVENLGLAVERTPDGRRPLPTRIQGVAAGPVRRDLKVGDADI